MKDDVYNRFKKELSGYHRKGYSMEYPATEVTYNEVNRETVVYIQLGMTKRGKDKELLGA